MDRPEGCAGCSLETKGSSFYPPEGPDWADMVFVGDSPGDAVADSKLTSLLKKAGISPEGVKRTNILSCKPPQRPLGQSWVGEAASQCQQYLEPALRQPRVVIAGGQMASRQLLRQYGKLDLNNWHGTVNEVEGRLVVPTFHPNMLLSGRNDRPDQPFRGNSPKLTGVVLFGLLRAKSVADGTYKHEAAALRVDPPLEWFSRWIDRFLEALALGQDLWLAVDVETVEKLKGGAEDELKGSGVEIVRINFSCNPDEGLTVPWVGEYITESRRLIEAAKLLIFHNWRYDVPLLREAQISIGHGKFMDTMNMFKMLQSDLPLGLGFIAPFFSRYPAWKHLSGSDPGRYAAIDAFQTLRCAYGIKRDLLKSGQWDTYLRHTYDLDRLVLHPAEEVGLYIDRAKLVEFREQLVVKEGILQAKIQAQVGEDGRPLCSGAISKKSGFRGRGKGWKKAPKKLLPGETLVETVIEMEVYVCTGPCGAKDVTAKHRCPAVKPPKLPKKPRKKKSSDVLL